MIRFAENSANPTHRNPSRREPIHRDPSRRCTYVIATQVIALQKFLTLYITMDENESMDKDIRLQETLKPTTLSFM
jgi:type II secretory pathway component PulC